MTLVQVTQREGIIKRLAPDQDPYIELQLKPGERVVECGWRPLNGTAERKTIDYAWWLITEWRDPTNEHEPGDPSPAELGTAGVANG